MIGDSLFFHGFNLLNHGYRKKYKHALYTGFIGIILLSNQGCSSTEVVSSLPEVDESPLDIDTSPEAFTPLDFQTNPTDEYLLIYSQWEGTVYRLGGITKQGVDCSAFVQQLHHSLSKPILLPRTTSDQSKQGHEIQFKERQAGDLVFFKTSRRVWHVGILIDADHFIHASTSKGVTTTRLDNPYWKAKFWQIRRIV